MGSSKSKVDNPSRRVGKSWMFDDISNYISGDDEKQNVTNSLTPTDAQRTYVADLLVLGWPRRNISLSIPMDILQIVIAFLSTHCADLTALNFVTLSSVLSNCHSRFCAKHYFSRISIADSLSNVLLFVNPHQCPPTDTDREKEVKEYVTTKEKEKRKEKPNAKELLRNGSLFDFADDSLSTLADKQCIVLNGDSGSGKTELMKLLCHFYHFRFLRRTTNAESKANEVNEANENSEVNDAELETIAVAPSVAFTALHSFANATTATNANASRCVSVFDFIFSDKS